MSADELLRGRGRRIHAPAHVEWSNDPGAYEAGARLGGVRPRRAQPQMKRAPGRDGSPRSGPTWRRDADDVSRDFTAHAGVDGRPVLPVAVPRERDVRFGSPSFSRWKYDCCGKNALIYFYTYLLRLLLSHTYFRNCLNSDMQFFLIT